MAAKSSFLSHSIGMRPAGSGDNGHDPDAGNDHSERVRAPQSPQTSTRTVTVDSALAVNIYGSADAFGENTLASASVDIQVVDRGLAILAVGQATFTAAATSCDDGSAFAAIQAGLDFAGEDLSVVTGRSVSFSDEKSALEMTSLQFAAMDLKFETCLAAERSQLPEEATPRSSIGVLEGNLALFDIDVSASGENSFVNLQTDVLVVEDQLSTVTVTATSAVDTTTIYTEITGSARSERITTGSGHALVRAGKGDDKVFGADGNDWMFGERGDDLLDGGWGDDTLFGGEGSDRIRGGEGGDWLFGGDAKDRLDGGAGDDLLLGGDDKDELYGKEGWDILHGGSGRDTLDGGAGDDILILGGYGGDGDDIYRGGSGADRYLLTDSFDRDVVSDFSIAEGDRLVLADLEELLGSGQCALGMQRSAKDSDDLVISFEIFDGRSELILDEFFRINPDYAILPRRGLFSDVQAELLLGAIAVDPDHHADIGNAALIFQLADMLSLMG